MLWMLTAVVMAVFASNAVLCRLALQSGLDPVTFTSLRLASGALSLWLIVRLRRTGAPRRDWLASLALFLYMITFSVAYERLPAAVGTLILSTSLEAGMLGYGLWSGERPGSAQTLGMGLALAGMIGLLWPGLSAPPPGSALWMLGAGAAWSVYCLRGRGQKDPVGASFRNFSGAVLPALILSIALRSHFAWNGTGAGWAVAAGAVTSSLAYTAWYLLVPHLTVSAAAVVQLSVPVFAALGGILFLNEPLTLHLLLSSVCVLAGLGMVLVGRPRRLPEAGSGPGA